MKFLKITFIITSILLISSCDHKKNSQLKIRNSNVIKFSGSTTIKPIIEKITETFKFTNDTINFEIEAKGSHVGFQDMSNDKCDIGMSSKKISSAEKKIFKEKKIEYVENLFAGDAIVFLVNVNNRVKQLTKEQIEDILIGKIANWKELGGKDLSITVVSRDSNSGTYSFVEDEILKGQPLNKKTKYIHNNEDIIESVTNDPSIFTYSSFSSIDYSVDPLSISFDKGNTFVSPRYETVNNQKYQFFRGLYLYYKATNYQKVLPIIEFIETDTIQKLIKKNGYIPFNRNMMGD